MRRIRAMGLTLVMLSVSAQTAFAFPDTETSWYRDDIDTLLYKNIVQGYVDGTFKPLQAVNRAEFLKVLLADSAEAPVPKRRCFPDVSSRDWFAPYVCAAKQRGIVTGQRGGLFQPEASINQAEALKMLLLARGERIQEGSANPWYEPYLERAEELGIASQASALPWDTVTRERMAGLLARSLREEETDRPGNLSAGCFTAPPDTPPSSLETGGQTRTFILALPRDYSSRDPHPLIVAFHGRTNSNERVREYYRLEQTGLDAIVVYPAGNRQKDGTYTWSPTADLRYFDVLVKDIASRYCVDMDKLFAVGHSLGAWFANTVGCAYGSVVRATAAVAGQPSSGRCNNPIAGIFMHDRRDQLVAFKDGERSRDQRAVQNACGEGTLPRASSGLGCEEVRDCRTGEPVLWCPHGEGGANGHQWPDGAGRVIADFFRSLP
jgi:polyhydroxybutyrate depolymerase